MHKRTIFLYTAIVAFIAGIISLVFMLKDEHEAVDVTNYISHENSSTRANNNKTHLNSDKETVITDLGDTKKGPMITEGAGETNYSTAPHNVSENLSYDSPIQRKDGVNIYKTTCPLHAPVKPAVGQTVKIAVPYSEEPGQEGSVTTVTYTFVLDHVEPRNRELTSVHGNIIRRDTQTGTGNPQGEVIMLIISGHITVNLHDQTNKRMYYLFYSGTEEQVEYTVEEMNTDIFPARPKATDIR